MWPPGTIPQVLQKMQALGFLNLMGNGFNGTLPEQCDTSPQQAFHPHLSGGFANSMRVTA